MKPIKTVTARNVEELVKALGLPPEKAAEFELRHELARQLHAIIARENLTHAKVAKAAGTSRSRVTAILNGTYAGVSTDLLLRILKSLGYRAKISFTRIKAA